MTSETDKSIKYSKGLSSHQLVRGYMSGEIPQQEYAKLFEQNHKGIDLIQMLSKRDQNEIYNEYPCLRAKDDNNQGRFSLEEFFDNCENKKNQVIEKVVESLRKLSFLKK